MTTNEKKEERKACFLCLLLFLCYLSFLIGSLRQKFNICSPKFAFWHAKVVPFLENA